MKSNSGSTKPTKPNQLYVNCQGAATENRSGTFLFRATPDN